MSNEKDVNPVENDAERAMRKTAPWLILFGRFGYAVKGVVYVLIGLIAAAAVFGTAAEIIGTRGALRYIVELPLGQFALAAVAAGLLCHALWRMIQAVADAEHKGSGAKGILLRAGYAARSLAYLGLAFSAAKIFLGARNPASAWAGSWTAFLLLQPFGQWLVGVVGAVVIGIGFSNFYKSFTAKFRRNLMLGEMSEREETWITRIGRFGYAARGAVFCLIGWFLIAAAAADQASRALGLGGALQKLEQQPFGAWLLAVVAAGLVAYGVFMIVLGRYRRMTIA